MSRSHNQDKINWAKIGLPENFGSDRKKMMCPVCLERHSHSSLAEHIAEHLPHKCLQIARCTNENCKQRNIYSPPYLTGHLKSGTHKLIVPNKRCSHRNTMQLAHDRLMSIAIYLGYVDNNLCSTTGNSEHIQKFLHKRESISQLFNLNEKGAPHACFVDEYNKEMEDHRKSRECSSSNRTPEYCRTPAAAATPGYHEQGRSPAELQERTSNDDGAGQYQGGGTTRSPSGNHTSRSQSGYDNHRNTTGYDNHRSPSDSHISRSQSGYDNHRNPSGYDNHRSPSDSHTSRTQSGNCTPRPIRSPAEYDCRTPGQFNFGNSPPRERRQPKSIKKEPADGLYGATTSMQARPDRKRKEPCSSNIAGTSSYNNHPPPPLVHSYIPSRAPSSYSTTSTIPPPTSTAPMSHLRGVADYQHNLSSAAVPPPPANISGGYNAHNLSSVAVPPAPANISGGYNAHNLSSAAVPPAPANISGEYNAGYSLPTVYIRIPNYAYPPHNLSSAGVPPAPANISEGYNAYNRSTAGVPPPPANNISGGYNAHNSAGNPFGNFTQPAPSSSSLPNPRNDTIQNQSYGRKRITPRKPNASKIFD